MKFFLILILFGIYQHGSASPNAVINLDAHYDSQFNLIAPDKYLMRKAIKSYQNGYNSSALTKFKQAAAFGNSDAQMYIGLMYLKALGSPQDWAKGYAWIRLAALDQTRKHLQLKDSVYSQLKESEIKQSEIEFEKISTEYGQSTALKRRDRWVKRQKQKSTGSRVGGQTGNVKTYRDLRNLNSGSVSSTNSVDSAIREMEKFVNNYNFGIITQGEIVTKDN